MKNSKVLICDDSITNVVIFSNLIHSEVGSKVESVTDPRQVMGRLDKGEFDLLLLDYEMPHLTGIEVVAQVREKYSQNELPIIIVTGRQDTKTRNRALSEGANDYANKPIDPIEISLRVRNLLTVSNSYKLQGNINDELEERVEERTKELNHFTESLINRLSMAGELRDNQTGQHVIRVGKYSGVLATGLGLTSELVYMIERTAPMHDVGKIGIRDNILLKPGKLTDEEFEIMKGHALYADQILGNSESILIQMASSIAVSHHEKWNGKGYPRGIDQESIPIEGRIVAIADVFDALTSERPYKKVWDTEDAIKLINDESGQSFDPALVKVFNENLEQILAVKEQYAD